MNAVVSEKWDTKGSFDSVIVCNYKGNSPTQPRVSRIIIASTGTGSTKRAYTVDEKINVIKYYSANNPTKSLNDVAKKFKIPTGTVKMFWSKALRQSSYYFIGKFEYRRCTRSPTIVIGTAKEPVLFSLVSDDK